MDYIDKIIEEFYKTQNQTLNILPSKLREQATKGNVDSMFEYANTIISLPEGLLPPEQNLLANTLMLRASSEGHEEAKCHIALLYITGESKYLRKDVEAGKEILKELKNSKSTIVQNFISWFDHRYFELSTQEEKSEYLFKKMNKIVEEDIPEHASNTFKQIPKAFELTEEFIIRKEVLRDDRELFAQYLNEHVISAVFNLDDIDRTEELLNDNPYALKEVLDKWEKMKFILRPHDYYMSLKGLTIDEIKEAVSKAEQFTL